MIATVKAQYEKAMGILRDHAAKLNELAGYLLEKETITGEEFMDILNTCEFARYAPAQASDAMDKLYEQTVDAIGKMENTIKK